MSLKWTQMPNIMIATQPLTNCKDIFEVMNVLASSCCVVDLWESSYSNKCAELSISSVRYITTNSGCNGLEEFEYECVGKILVDSEPDRYSIRKQGDTYGFMAGSVAAITPSNSEWKRPSAPPFYFNNCHNLFILPSCQTKLQQGDIWRVNQKIFVPKQAFTKPNLATIAVEAKSFDAPSKRIAEDFADIARRMKK